MRLQISVQRHNLPTVDLIFATGTGPASRTGFQNATVADLIHDLNELVPLESADGEWGLEDYVVDLDYSSSSDSHGGAYECLHFLPIENVLREDDTVTVRAITTEELKEKRLGGRLQISKDGRHLIDGVAFGKRWLRNSARPGIIIPPRKKRLLGLEGEQEDQNLTISYDLEQAAGALIALPVDSEDEEYNDEDEDFMPNGEKTVSVREVFDDTDSLSDDEYSSEDSDEDMSGELRLLLKDASNLEDAQNKTAHSKGIVRQGGKTNLKRKRQPADSDDEMPKRVTFEKVSDSNNVPLRNSTYNSDSDSSSDLSSSSDTTDSAESAHRSNDSLTSSESGSSSLASNSALGSLSESDSDWTSSSGSSSESDDEESKDRAKAQENESSVISSDKTATKVFPERKVPILTPPGGGSNQTSKRNARTKTRKRLQALKTQGLLSNDASFEDMYKYEEAQQRYGSSAEHVNQNEQDYSQNESMEAIRQQVLGRLQSQDSNSDQQRNLSGPPDSVEGQPKTPKFDKTTQDGPSTPNETVRGAQTNPLAPIIQSHTQTQTKRPKLDLASSRRMLFSSLGVRIPKTPAEEQALREKLAKTKQNQSRRDVDSAVTTDKPTAQSPQATPIDNTWKSKLVVSAVECEQNGVHLKPPPFPFEQGWWKTTNTKVKDNAENEPHSSHARSRSQEPAIETFSANNERIETQDSSAVNELGKIPIYVDEVDRVPVPEDFVSLPSLDEKDLVENAIIAYKELHLNQTTNFQPEISSYKIARVVHLHNKDSIDVVVAKPYREALPQHDLESGRRIYSKFEIPAVGNNDDIDDGFREVSFANMIDPKLVRNASNSVPESQIKGCSSLEITDDPNNSQANTATEFIQQSPPAKILAEALNHDTGKLQNFGEGHENEFRSSREERSKQQNDHTYATCLTTQLSAQLLSSAQHDQYPFESADGQEHDNNSLVSLQTIERPIFSSNSSPVVSPPHLLQELQAPLPNLKLGESSAEPHVGRIVPDIQGDFSTHISNGPSQEDPLEHRDKNSTANDDTVREDSPSDLIECVVPEQLSSPEKEASLSFSTSALGPMQDEDERVLESESGGRVSLTEFHNIGSNSSNNASPDRSFISLKYRAEQSTNPSDLASPPPSMNLRKRPYSKTTLPSRTYVSESPSLDHSIIKTDVPPSDRFDNQGPTQDDAVSKTASDASTNVHSKTGKQNRKAGKGKQKDKVSDIKAAQSTISTVNGKKPKHALLANKRTKN